jgi:hypothetical protein
MANGLTRKGECHGILDSGSGCRYSRYRHNEINLAWKLLLDNLGESVESKAFLGIRVGCALSGGCQCSTSASIRQLTQVQSPNGLSTWSLFVMVRV